MKQIRWQGIAFFLLIFLLAIGLSYLAFNEKTAEKPEEKHTMRVALVNEDEGTRFNGKQIVFGDEFAAGINKDSRHDWYLVSRGVAESGFDRNAYDMMIVIPNDFSEKSLSIHLERPEPVSLHYKINATGHEDVRAEAEKTAGKILNDFNTRLIDVYFASIIGNLQDAQDNINDIIHEEVAYMDDYNNNIHSPLANYTNQFSSLHSYTNNSIENHQGLENVLDTFGKSLTDDANNNQAFATEIDSIIRQKEDNSTLANQFNAFFQQFLENMQDQNVYATLTQLEQKNRQVHGQFQPEKEADSEEFVSLARIEGPKTLLTRAEKLQTNLATRQAEINELQEKLHQKIDHDLGNVIRDGLEDAFEKGDMDEDLNEFLPELDERIHAEIQSQINRLPTLSLEKLNESKLTGETLENVKQTIRMGRKYSESKEFGFQPELIDGELPFTKRIQEIKGLLAKDGVNVTDNLTVSNSGNTKVKVEAPEDYILENYEVNEKPDKNEKHIEIKATFKLKDKDVPIDVFAPIEWSWEVQQEDEEKTTENNPDNGGGSNDGKDEGNGSKDDVSKLDASIEKPEPPQTDDQPEEKEAEDEEDLTPGNKDEPEDTNPPTLDKDLDADTDGGSTGSTSETIIQTNNYFKQRVHSSLQADGIDQVIATTEEMVSEYHRLDALFELYFGIDGFNFEENLVDEASKDSLYYFIHKMDFKSIVQENISTKIIKQITADVQTSLEAFKKNITEYNLAIKETSKRSNELVGIVDDTRNNANALNGEVTALLEEIKEWHEISQALGEDQSIVLDSDGEMGTALISLNQNYQPLLMASATLQDQAQSNFDSADRVYQTLDALDREANAIQDSGANLVAHAETLADNLTNKAVEDTDFATNFNEVLANSRIGDRQNEHLYRFLANPVQTENDGVITERENFTAYFLVLIMAMLTLFTAYVLSNMGQRKMIGNTFSEDATLIGRNMPITLITAGIGVIEGLVIGLASHYLLSLEQGTLLIWLGLIVLITMTMLLIATYLLRQINMIGMFILLTVFSLYLLLTTSLGFRFENASLVAALRDLSPLQYAEMLLTHMLDGKEFFVLLTIIFLVVLTGIGFVVNLLVFHKQVGRKVDEDTAEAN
jgi:type VII secretion EsaA-like protein